MLSLKGYWLRKFLHLAGALLPLAYLVAPAARDGLVVFTLGFSILCLGFDALRFSWPNINGWFVKRYGYGLKEEEKKGITGSGLFFFSSAMALILFPRPVTIASLFFLTIGDLAAALADRRWQVGRGKHICGALACFGVSWLLGLMLLSPWVAGMGAAVACLAEFLSGPARLDDNLTIPLLAGGVMTWLSP